MQHLLAPDKWQPYVQRAQLLGGFQEDGFYKEGYKCIGPNSGIAGPLNYSFEYCLLWFAKQGDVRPLFFVLYRNRKYEWIEHGATVPYCGELGLARSYDEFRAIARRITPEFLEEEQVIEQIEAPAAQSKFEFANRLRDFENKYPDFDKALKNLCRDYLNRVGQKNMWLLFLDRAAKCRQSDDFSQQDVQAFSRDLVALEKQHPQAGQVLKGLLTQYKGITYAVLWRFYLA